VRQREHDRVVAGEHLGRGVLEQPVGQRGQVRVDAAEKLPGVGRGGQHPDLELGVLEQQPHDLPAGVPARPGDCDTSHVHDYTEFLDSMHKRSGTPVTTFPPGARTFTFAPQRKGC
jgi:hypothetical protein